MVCHSLQDNLIDEGNFELIDKLAKAARHEPGYGTIVVTRKGFSRNDFIHNRVLHFLKDNKIHTLNLVHEIGNLELALHSGIKAVKRIKKLSAVCT